VQTKSGRIRRLAWREHDGECNGDLSPIKSLRQWVPGQLFAEILTLIARAKAPPAPAR